MILVYGVERYVVQIWFNIKHTHTHALSVSVITAKKRITTAMNRLLLLGAMSWTQPSVHEGYMMVHTLLLLPPVGLGRCHWEPLQLAARSLYHHTENVEYRS